MQQNRTALPVLEKQRGFKGHTYHSGQSSTIWATTVLYSPASEAFSVGQACLHVHLSFFISD